ncbi:transcription regulator NOT2/NOT3/NOT5-like protein [Tanacetum coccineum]
MGNENSNRPRTLGHYSRPSHKGYQNAIELPEGCDNRDLNRLKWFSYVHDVILEVNDYLILCAYEFGVKYSICSRVVIMEMKDVLHALLRQFLVIKCLIAIVGRATEVSSLLNQALVTSGVGLSPILGNHGSRITGLGNPGSRITGSAGNIGGHSRIERSMSFEGVLSIPYLTSRLNLNTNSGFGNLSMQPRFKIPASVLMPIACILANSAKALCKVRGEIDVEFKDEANAADLYKVIVLVG